MHYGVIQLLTDISGGEMLSLYTRNLQQDFLSSSADQSAVQTSLNHQLSEAVDINETRFAYRKDYII